MTPDRSRTTDAATADRADDRLVRSWSPEWRSRADLVVLAAVVGAFGVVAGLPGVAVGVGLALGWVVLPNVAVFAAGVVAATALVPDGAALPTAVPPVGALAGLLCTSTVSDDRIRDVGAVLGAWTALTAVVFGVYVTTDALWLAALALAAVGGVGFISVDLFGLNQSGLPDDEQY